MNTLILGHGRKYNKNNIRCSPLCIEKWYNDEYLCVDIDPLLNPDIICDLRKDWLFCNKNDYDRIIDTSGIALGGGNTKYNKHGFKTKIFNYLNENGIFYGRDICWQKQGEHLIEIKI